ncbi:hypothetical protein ABZ883_21300 [Streptomyces sp. NPDC046977]|uniref:hypothetical protein n=1 Tax=Streptomyces sp. NPDC046977 TaxID=3154703 RepID=UPI0033FC44DB
MGAARDGEKERTRELAREAVRRLAPQELPFFEETADAYFEDPAQAPWKARAEPLGIGIEALAVGSWTLFALPVATSVVGTIATDRLREAHRRGWWRRRGALEEDRTDGAPDGEAAGGQDGVADNPFAAPGAARSAAPVGQGPWDLDLLRRVAYDNGVRLGLSPDQAGLLADAVLGGFVAGRDASAPGAAGRSASGGGAEDTPS